MIGTVKNKLIRNLVNLPGWHTQHKIVVFESDDWGAIRMVSPESYRTLLKQGYKVDECPYNRNDALESNDDLAGLLEVLAGFKDSRGVPPVFTMNMIMANPDFGTIKEAGYQQYHYEYFSKTLSNYPRHDQVISLYNEGIAAGLLKPQFHGREHVNITNWLGALQIGQQAAHDAFLQNMFTVYRGKGSNCRKEFLDAFDIHPNLLNLSVSEGTAMFKNVFGYVPTSIMAPCYTWSLNDEKLFYSNGYKHLQSGRVQRIPQKGKRAYINKRRFAGQRNKLGQVYTIRNSVFEPATDLKKDWVDTCLKEIQTAFFWRKPAIISTHRLNYIGFLNPDNRSTNLKLLKKLLRAILKKWPDVEFLSSDQLADQILNDQG